RAGGPRGAARLRQPGLPHPPRRVVAGAAGVVQGAGRGRGMNAVAEEIIEAPPARPKGRQAAFGFIFASSVMNAVSFGLMIPVLPALIRSFYGASANDSTTAAAADWQFVFGLTWGVMQFFSGPVLGMLSDRFGRRPGLLLAI